MALTIFGNDSNVANIVIAKVSATFESMGFDETNIDYIMEVGDGGYKSFVPGRTINPIDGTTAGKGYYIVAKEDVDISDWFETDGGGADATANNGLFNNEGSIQMGQPSGEAGDPAALLNDTEIPLSGHALEFKDGAITSSGSPVNIIGATSKKLNEPGFGVLISNRDALPPDIYFDPRINEPVDQGGIYNPSLVTIQQVYKEELGDVLNLQYGGPLQILDKMQYLEDSDTFKVGGSNVRFPNKGVYVQNRIFPPAHQVNVETWMDGAGASSVRGSMDIGMAYGYFMNILAGSNLPGWTLNNFESSIDFQREAYMTGQRKITGAGISNYTAWWKSEQRAINAAWEAMGHLIEQVTGFHAYGSTDINLQGTGSPTKAQIMAYSEVNKSFGFYAQPQCRSLNEVRNGYGFVSAGALDRNWLAGYLRLGGALPTDETGGQADRLHVNGDALVTGLIKVLYGIFKSDGSASDQRIWVQQNDPNGRLIFGRGGTETATMQIAGTNVGSGYDNRGGISATIRTYNQGSNWERAKFFISVDDNPTGAGGTFSHRLVIDRDTVAIGGTMASDSSYSGHLLRIHTTDGVQVKTKLTLPTTTVSANTSLDNHHTVRVDATASAIDITLPSAATTTGRVYVVKKIDASVNNVNIVGTVNGVSGYAITAQHKGVTVQSNGTDWDVIGSF